MIHEGHVSMKLGHTLEWHDFYTAHICRMPKGAIELGKHIKCQVRCGSEVDAMHTHIARIHIAQYIYIAHSRNQVTCGAHLYVWNAIKLSLNVASTTPPVQSSAVQSLAPTYICECENMATQEEGLLWIWCRQNEWAPKKHTQKLCPYGSQIYSCVWKSKKHVVEIRWNY